MKIVTWSEIARWYDKKIGEEGDLWHRYLIDPGLLELVGDVRGLSVLDLACGNGYLARRFAREGARRVVAVDASVPVIRLARAREARDPRGVRYEVRNAARLTRITSASFDLVVSNMAIMDIADAESAIREIARVTRLGGRFVFSISHPCFDTNERSLWVVERVMFENVVWRKVRGYRVEGEQLGIWRPGSKKYWATRSYHRTLSTYSRFLSDAGFAITRLGEPSPEEPMLRESPQGEWIREIPLHLIVEAIRLDRPTAKARRRATSYRVGARGEQRRNRRR